EERSHFLFVPGGTDLTSMIGLSEISIKEAYDNVMKNIELIEAPDKKYSGKAWDIFEEKRKRVEEWYGKIY
ncbi:MAG: hypothetical protein QW607_10320, partial [Desulfurococcaceae archaeon]